MFFFEGRETERRSPLTLGDNMPTIPHFDPPANLTDFDTITDQRAAWDEFIGLSFQANIEDVQAEIGAGKSQFYNPKVTSTDPPVATDVIRWKGFPLVLSAKHPGNEKAALAEADQLTNKLPNGATFPFQFRPQDEYLEWFVTRNQQGKITRVVFTCEGPEYWEALAHGYPPVYTRPRSQGGLGGTKHTNAQGDKQKLQDLYQQFVGQTVQLTDLFDANGRYKRWNKWNTTEGLFTSTTLLTRWALRLTSPPKPPSCGRMTMGRSSPTRTL